MLQHHCGRSGPDPESHQGPTRLRHLEGFPRGKNRPDPED
jgi:hypothetical protein